MADFSIATQGLTDQQKSFVLHTVAGMSANLAARAAGYSSPDTAGHRIRALPHVQQAIREAMWLQIQTDDAPAARRVLREILDDTEAPRPIRVECAKILLNRGGFVEPKAQTAAGGIDKPVSEMTGNELQVAILKLQGELGNRMSAAKLIEGVSEPVHDKTPPQLIDILE